MPDEQAQAQVSVLLQQSPWQVGLARSRWWLAGLRQVVSWLSGCCLATVQHTLARWKLVYRRGRRAVHSPDWEYPSKVQRIETITWYCQRQPERLVKLYEDELTYYRKPTVAQGYAPAGSSELRADQGQGYNRTRRIAACLDPRTGQLLAWQRAEFDRHTLLRFYQFVEQRYPQAEQIFLIQDNWPVHWHPDLVAGLRGSKLTLVALPTYAPWLEVGPRRSGANSTRRSYISIPGPRPGSSYKRLSRPGWISGLRGPSTYYATSVFVPIKL